MCFLASCVFNRCIVLTYIRIVGLCCSQRIFTSLAEEPYAGVILEDTQKSLRVCLAHHILKLLTFIHASLSLTTAARGPCFAFSGGGQAQRTGQADAMTVALSLKLPNIADHNGVAMCCLEKLKPSLAGWFAFVLLKCSALVASQGSMESNVGHGSLVPK